MANYLSEEKRKQLFHLLCEGNGLSSISRIIGCSKNTIPKLQDRYCRIIDFINKKHIHDLNIEEIEADELRTFVYNKTNLKWIYVALDRKSRMVVHFHIGKRDTKDARIFLTGLSDKLNDVSKVSTDCLKSYVSAIANNPSNINPSSKMESINLLRSKNFGKGLERSITNRIETHNGNIRQHISKLARRTRCFSKKEESLRQHLTLFFFYYNFIKIHKALSTTPCVSAGILSTPFTFEQLIEYDRMFTGQTGSPNKKEEAITIISSNKEVAKVVPFILKAIPKYDDEYFQQKAKSEAAAHLGRLGGLKGGIARAAKLTPERRKEIAQKAALARWGEKDLKSVVSL